MPEFKVKDGHFWLDGEPQLIQAGEFHYFRTPPDQWRHRLGLLQAAGFNTLATYIPWLWHEVEEGEFDLDGHGHPMRDLAGFLDLAAEMGFWLIPRPGPYIMAETINEGIPPWVFARYPQVAFISQNGQAQNLASYLHPDFLQCVSAWYRAVFGVLAPRQVTRGGRILLVQLDNEMGMAQWVRNILDVNPDTVARLARHVCDRYANRLRERYLTDDLPTLLRESLLRPQAPHAALVVADYRDFYRDYLREYAAYLWAQARACGLEVPPVINIHGFANGGKTFPIGLSQLIKVMRLGGMISATDVYPLVIGEGNYHELLLVNEMTKAVQNPAQALFSIEFQSGGNLEFGNGQASLYDLYTRLCVSNGLRAVNHYLFCDGENDPILSPIRRHEWGQPVRKDGSLRRHYPRYARLSRVLSAYGTDLVRAQPETVTTIGFMLDHFKTEVNNEFTQDDTRRLTYQRENILFDFIARGLALSHRPFRAVDLDHAPLDSAEMPACWVMLEKQCGADTQHKLVDYLQRGGRLILVGRMCVETFDGERYTVLPEALGIETMANEPPYLQSTLRVFDYPYVPVSMVECYTGAFDEVFATRAGGEVVGFLKTVGRGAAMVLGATFPVTSLEDLDILDRMARRMGVAPAFAVSEWVDVRLSRGAQGSFLFINNYQDDPVETTIAHHGQPLLGGHAVHVPARQGAILPLNWQVRPGITVNYATSEIVAVAGDGAGLRLKTALPEFVAELTLEGYRCDEVEDVKEAGRRVRVRGKAGTITLR